MRKLLSLCLLLFLLAATPGLLHSHTAAAAASRPGDYTNPEQYVTASPAERLAAQRSMADWASQLSANVAGEPVDSVYAMQNVAQWTFMVYIAADNDLEEFALLDLNEMELVGSTTTVNIVTQVDRATGYDTSNGNWTDARRFFITRDNNFDVFASQPVGTVGEINTGDPANLADFATWAIQTYPAQHYALIVWDHGAAWLGSATDEASDSDDLSLPELDSALAQITSATGVSQLDLVGFDACLMGQFEVMQTLAPYANYGIGAEEVIPGFGWDYSTPLNTLNQNPNVDGATLGRALVDGFMSFYTEVVTYYDVFDLGVYDLSRADSVASALDNFSEVVQQNPAAVLSALGDARNNTISFGGFDDPQYFDIWSSADLIHFMELLANLTNNSALTQAAQGVAAAAQSMVHYHLANEGLADARGMTIYFPRNQAAYEQYGFSQRYAEQAPPTMASWRQFLSTFHNTAIETVSEASSIEILGVYPEIASIHDPAVLQMEITGRDIVNVVFTATLNFDDGTAIIVEYEPLVSSVVTESGETITNWADGVSTVTFGWNAEIPVISDGEVEIPTLVFVNQESPDSATVYGQFIPAVGEAVDAHLVYDLVSGQVTSVWGIRETQNGFVPFELAVKPGDQFQPEWLFLDTNNELVSEPANNVLTFSDTPFTYRLAPAPTGVYTLEVLVEDIAGNMVSDSVDVQVNNEGLDEAQRGFTDINFGINFLYPANWIEPQFFDAGDGVGRLFTGNAGTGVLLTVLPYDNVSSGQDVAQQVIDSWNALENAQLVDQQQVDLGGYDSYVVDYTYTLQGTERSGAVLAIYVPEQGIGYGFDLDAPSSEIEEAGAAFQLLVNSVNFFNVEGSLGTSNWTTVAAAGGLISFSIPNGWVETDIAPWTIFSAEGDTSVFAALNVSTSQGLSNEELAQQYFGLLQQNTNVSNVQILGSEPYFIGNESWHAVVFSLNYADGSAGVGAYFVTNIGTQEYVFWIEAPEAVFDQTFNDLFSVIINSFTFNG